MKQHRNVSSRQEALSERGLFAAVLTLKSVDECRAFFRDLCTPAELQALADRWAVVEWLQKGLPYREITSHYWRERHNDRPRGPLPGGRQRWLRDRGATTQTEPITGHLPGGRKDNTWTKNRGSNSPCRNPGA